MIVTLVKMRRELREEIAQKTGEPVEACPPEREEELLPRADIMIGSMRLTERQLALAGRLRWFYCVSAGVERLPFAALARREVLVTNASGIHASPMAEHALMMMLAFRRRLLEYRASQRRKEWSRLIPGELRGAVLCVVGTGSIGRETARRARVFGMRVTGVRRSPRPMDEFDAVYGLPDLPRALGEADFVLLLTPLTDETRGLMGAAEFAAMKQEAVFLNLSRGGTVDEPALVAALRAGHIAGAGLDVFAREPLGPDSSLWRMENVILTPHIAGITDHYMESAAELFLRNYQELRAGDTPRNRVDLGRQY